MGKGPLAGKNKKAVNDQYKMKLGPGLDKKLSIKTRAKSIRPAEDSLDEPRTQEEISTTTQATPQQVQKRLTGNSHGEMHAAMDRLEEKPAVNKKNQRNQTLKPRESKKLSMF